MSCTPLSAVELPDDPELKRLVGNIAEQLPASNTRAPNELLELRDSCTNLSAVIAFHPSVGRYVCPHLVAILEHELQHSHHSAVTDMLLGGMSREIERVIVDILSDVCGPALVRAYQESDQKIASLVQVLGQVITTGRTTQAVVSSIEALAELTKAVPERIAAELPVARVVPAICEHIFQFHYTNQYRTGMRLLAVLSVFTDSMPKGDVLAEPCWHAEETGDGFCRAYTAVVRVTLGLSPDHTDALQVDTVDELVLKLGEKLKTAADHQREPAAKILGEVCAICSHCVDVPQPLLDEVYTSGGWDREALLQAVGIFVGYRPQTADDLSALFEDRIHDATGPDRWYAARIFGELVTVTVTRRELCDQSSLLIERVREASGRERGLPARALGLSVCYCDGVADVDLFRIAKRITSTTGQTRRLAARALGEICAVEPSWIPHLPQPLVNAVKESTDWNHWMAAQVLGEVAAMRLDTGGPDFSFLINEVIATTGRDRRLAAQALGEAGLQHPETRTEIPAQLREEVTTATGPDRWLAARVCGEILVARHRSEQQLLDSLRTEFQAATDRDRKLAAEALGLVVASVSVPTITVPETLLEAVTQSTNRDRRLAAEALGRIVGTDTEAETYTELARAVQSREGLNRWNTARLLGEVSAALSSEENIPVPEAVARIHRTRGDGRNWAARVVGEAIAVDRTTTGELVSALKDRVLNTAGLDQRLASQTLGELLSVQESEREELPTGLLSDVQTGTGSERWYAAWAVGLIVAYGSVHSAITTVVTAMYDETLEVDTLSPLLGILSAASDLTLEQFFEAVSDSQHTTTDGKRCIRAFFELGDTAGYHALTAIATLVSRSESTDASSRIRGEIQTVLTDQDAIETRSRLEAIDVLSRTDSSI